MMADTLFANVGGKLIDVRVYPIPIRDDCTVRIFGIPHDMTRAEAEKMGRVICALATPGSDMGKGE